MGNNTESKELLAVITALHHETNHELDTINATGVLARFLWTIPVHQSFNNGHLGLLELFLCITTSGVREIDGMVDLNVVVEGDIFYFDSRTRLSAVHHNLSNFTGHTHESPTFQRA